MSADKRGPAGRGSQGSGAASQNHGASGADSSFTSDNIDRGRRKLLIGGTALVGGLGTVALAAPLLSSMSPSARALSAGAPAEADISKLEPGQMMIVEWRGKPVWIINRTEKALAGLTKVVDDLRDPDSNVPQQPPYAQNETRSIKPAIMVMVGVCTHLGCSPTYRPEVAPPDLGARWQGGFFCPCHGSKFDFAGRVYKGVPAPINLEVPPYRYASDTTIVIGEDSEAAA
ncbi:MAG: ubiquinol-cytochrome c reductase iron-sulfur subunit [Gammaproteobacteria bacterium]|nr:MAG: ubiquinol-cytochrome c reductase iron-sulfur subunit [Gammaproteobacteria bacterium]